MMQRLAAGFAAFLVGGFVHAANPTVEMKTNQGAITIELYPDKAPKTVENFLEYARSDFYKGTVFHRVIAGFMIQGGGFTTDSQQKKTRAAIANEAGNGLKNEVGTVAMARTSDPHRTHRSDRPAAAAPAPCPSRRCVARALQSAATVLRGSRGPG